MNRRWILFTIMMITMLIPIYADPYGLEYLVKAGKYTGVMAVSKTESYVQVIFQKKKDYAIGWMERSVYREQCLFYND